MDKLYICSPQGVEEVEILEETKGRFKVGRNSQFLRVINKSGLDVKCAGYVASLNRDRAIEIWNDEISKKIERLKGFLYTENI
ncbi:hypothetical protein [Clostridioides difficile]|uniref:hypothetical protein n=1 Tax=Clostridioides difficile TaxID=1496 RepID=UPI00038D9EDA|nr:hypothetical protein [Clostridioides difficile]EQI78395.1 hypothetical protein QQI_2905 [Clostridioides difficile Y401]MCI4869117.1 hypothetical protein [Clostridioides difficile]MCW0639134.1 hypothetical protein [Clostridioides difficile]MDC9275690.1 hypothetical protein [Clostridioides difficile]MDC9279917.1 hypothetical protein [Clostridioides difficile]